MSDNPKRVASEQFWRPYTPSKETPWDLRRVVHLHRRAGFAATVRERLWAPRRTVAARKKPQKLLGAWSQRRKLCR